MLLVCAMVSVACIVGYFLKDYAGVLIDKITGKILDAVLILAFG